MANEFRQPTASRWVVVTVLLSACATYQEPTQGPVAFISAAAPGFDLQLSYATDCSASASLPFREKVSVRIQAGDRAWIYASRGGQITGQCLGNISFVPEPTAHYLLKVEDCVYQLVRVHASGAFTAVPTQRNEGRRSCVGNK